MNTNENLLQPKENKMGVMPVKKLVVTMSWPIMLSMLVQALYNMVDGIFVSWASDKAFLALGYAFPAQSLMIAICAGTGVGVNALLARRLGEKNTEEASQVALHSYLIYFAIWLALAAFGLLAAKPFIGLYTTDPEVLRYGTDYLRIVTIGSIGMCMQFSAERILQASGNSIGPMIIQGAGALFNIIFDPILIFGYFGFPAMGVAGAAIATIAGQWLGMVIGFVMVLRNKIVPIPPRAFRFHGHLIVDIYRIGLPAILMQSLATVAVSIMNKFLGSISDAHMFVITAYIKIESFVLMPIFGLNNGVIPIISYNYGARKPDRIREAIRFSLALSMVIMCLGTLLPATLSLLVQRPGGRGSSGDHRSSYHQPLLPHGGHRHRAQRRVPSLGRPNPESYQFSHPHHSLPCSNRRPFYLSLSRRRLVLLSHLPGPVRHFERDLL